MRKYGWPIVLFMVVPFTAAIAKIAYFIAFDFGFFSYDSFLLPAVLGSLTTAMLLGVLYLRVRSDERATLRLAWSCTLTITVVRVLAFVIPILAGFSVVSSLAVLTLGALVGLVPLLWFARQASRLSLAHAFFLVAVVGGLTLYDDYDYLPFYFVWLWGLATSVLSVWLLANFDLRGHVFRRRSAVVVVALAGVGFLPLGLAVSRGGEGAAFFFPVVAFSFLVVAFSFLLLLLLIYLVRVRQPAVEVPPAPLSPA